MPKIRTTRFLSVLALAGAAALLAAATADAQPRRGGRGVSRVIVARPFYNPWFYNGWYGSPFMGGWYGYPIGFGYPYPPFGYGAYYRGGEVRVQVEPRATEVFVDGYYAGIVDDFDGTFQRLRVEPGEHEIQLYLSGYRSIQQKVYVQADKTFRIRETMEPLAPGDAPAARPVAPAQPPDAAGSGNAGRRVPDLPSERRRRAPQPPAARGESGSLIFRVQPSDAEILVDGERWQGMEGADRLVIQLSAGEHRVEVRKQGYSSFESIVRVQPGDSTPFNVSLTRQ